MRILLDSHALIWGVVEPERLSIRAREAMGGPAEDVVVSIVSLWEITIKMASGKLQSMGASIRDVTGVLAERGVEILPIQPRHLHRLERLPVHHRDPFDRLLIAQAVEEGLPILINDAAFGRYGVTVVW